MVDVAAIEKGVDNWKRKRLGLTILMVIISLGVAIFIGCIYGKYKYDKIKEQDYSAEMQGTIVEVNNSRLMLDIVDIFVQSSKIAILIYLNGVMLILYLRKELLSHFLNDKFGKCQNNIAYIETKRYMETISKYDIRRKYTINIWEVVQVNKLLNLGRFDETKEKLDSINYDRLPQRFKIYYLNFYGYYYRAINNTEKQAEYMDKLRKISGSKASLMLDRYDSNSETGYNLDVVKKMSNVREYLIHIVIYNFCEGEIAYKQGRLGEAKTRFQYVVDNGGDLIIKEKAKTYVEELSLVTSTPVEIKEVKKITKKSLILYLWVACVELIILVILLT